MRALAIQDSPLPATFRAQFEVDCPIRQTPTHSYYDSRAAMRREVPAAWEWREPYGGAWHGGFPTRDAAFVEAVHHQLHATQRRGHDVDQYHSLLALAWTLPLPAKWALAWEADFRPTRHLAYDARRNTLKVTSESHGRIPDPCRAPKQALLWGMDPELVRTAKARRAIAEFTSGDRKPGRISYGSGWLVDALCGQLDKYSDARMATDLSRVCRLIRDSGLADAFGLAPAGAQ